MLGETPHMAVTSLSATEGCRKAGHSCKRGSDRLYCSCRMVAQPEAPTAYLLEQVSCHGTNNQATWPSSAPGDGENASSESPFFPLPSYRLCPVPATLLCSFQSVGNFTIAHGGSLNTKNIPHHSSHHCQIGIKRKGRTEAKTTKQNQQIMKISLPSLHSSSVTSDRVTPPLWKQSRLDPRGANPQNTKVPFVGPRLVAE